jgi:hypothetical protein
MVSLKLLCSLAADDEFILAWLLVRGLEIAWEASRSKEGSTGPRNGLGRPAWAHFDPVRGLLCPVLLLESSRSFPLLHVGPCRQFLFELDELLTPQGSTLFWLGPRSFSSSRVWSLGFLESCLLHFMTCTGLQGLVMRSLMNISRKSCFQH